MLMSVQLAHVTTPLRMRKFTSYVNAYISQINTSISDDEKYHIIAFNIYSSGNDRIKANLPAIH